MVRGRFVSACELVSELIIAMLQTVARRLQPVQASRMRSKSKGRAPRQSRGLSENRFTQEFSMIRKLSDGKFRLYSRKLDPKTHKRRNLGTFGTRAAAEKHERAVQYFKHH